MRIVADTFAPEVRSRVMSTIRSSNTKPERVVRSILHKHGHRFRLSPHPKYALPCKPDILFPGKHKAVFVHGCFWHCHTCKKGRTRPASNRKFWNAKLRGNKERDKRALIELRKTGWRSYVIWACELKNTAKVIKKLEKFLNG